MVVGNVNDVQLSMSGPHAVTKEKIPLAIKVRTTVVQVAPSAPSLAPAPLPIGTTKVPLAVKQAKVKINVKAEEKLAQLAFIGTLYDFQEKVLEWTKDKSRGILALDMGLGKTATIIAKICLANYKKTLICVPLALMAQWQKAFILFTNIVAPDICIYQGNQRCLPRGNTYRIVLTTYDVIRTDMKNPFSALSKQRDKFDCIVLDEAHKIRNKDTATYVSCFEFARYCSARWLLSGTCIYNNFQDLVTMACFLDLPGFDPSKFKDTDYIESWKKKYYYRLTKAESGLKLPEKSVHEHYLNFDDTHMDVYVDIFTEFKEVYTSYMSAPSPVNFQNLLSKILRLRQCCNHPNAMLTPEQYNIEINRHKSLESAKFKQSVDIIKATPKNDKILVFSQWNNSLDRFAELLDKEGISHLDYNGQIKDVKVKDAVLEKFKTSPCKVLLVTLSSGGVGLNLTVANHVIILDSWWNPAQEEQAIDRVYRIGQTKKVEIHRLYMRGTIEEWLIEMKKEKQLIAAKFHEESMQYEINQALLKDLLHGHV